MTLAASPVDVGPALREQLFQQTKSVIMTSATLSIGKQPSFAFFRDRIGLTQCDELRLDSPFDYQEQAELVTRIAGNGGDGGSHNTAKGGDVSFALVHSNPSTDLKYTEIKYTLLKEVPQHSDHYSADDFHHA